MIVRAALCPSPPLLAAGVCGHAAVLPELREACEAAVGWLLAAAPDAVTVVGPAPVTASWPPDSVPDLSMHAPALNRLARSAGARHPRVGAVDPSSPPLPLAPAIGGPSSGPPSPPVPLALAIGTQLLDAAGYVGPRVLQSVAESASPDACRDLGRDLAADAPLTALLVMGDGSARRSAAAPGYLDDRAEPFDALVEQALRDGDLAALASLDPDLARDLLAAGRPAWQVLAAALALAPATPQAAASPPATASPAAASPTTASPATASPAVASPTTAFPATASPAVASGPATPATHAPADLTDPTRPRTRILYSAAPLGVAYLVATLDPTATR
jgi:hypothetical protein